MDGGASARVTPPAEPGSTDGPPSKPGPPNRRHRLLPLVVVAIVAGLGLAILAGFMSRGGPTRLESIRLGTRTPGELVSIDELRDRVARATAGEQPYKDAVGDLLDYAASTVSQEPRPQEPLEIRATEGPFVDDTAAAYGLALAWVVTGDDRYATASAGFIDAWVRMTKTTIGTCPDDGSCQTSLIIGRTAAGFVFAADLLRGSSAFPAAEETAFRDWLRAVILPTASQLPNNWGDAGTFLRIVATDYLGDTDGLRAAIERAYVQQDRIAADGHIPEETRREASGISYTQEALQYKVGSAVIAGRYGIDLWGYRGAGGATLQDAIDYLARYWSGKEAWPWDADPERPSTGPLWEIAFEQTRDPAFVPIIEQRRPFGSQGHSALRWTTLTNGIPLGASASGQPGATGESP